MDDCQTTWLRHDARGKLLMQYLSSLRCLRQPQGCHWHFTRTGIIRDKYTNGLQCNSTSKEARCEQADKERKVPTSISNVVGGIINAWSVAEHTCMHAQGFMAGHWTFQSAYRKLPVSLVANRPTVCQAPSSGSSLMRCSGLELLLEMLWHPC
ncbi:hypothetical protein BD289DRAFT_206565 [Coniella lustricola]|uniref:Uncharacterized protein n=1 Tax=Coniella lustricola TaxID=2025994 RepID=A0A2T3AC61_9PEZI|nr:hypothetical protein BD289DRAFT_206565 [Coniella lustricola]